MESSVKKIENGKKSLWKIHAIHLTLSKGKNHLDVEERIKVENEFRSATCLYDMWPSGLGEK